MYHLQAQMSEYDAEVTNLQKSGFYEKVKDYTETLGFLVRRVGSIRLKNTKQYTSSTP